MRQNSVASRRLGDEFVHSSLGHLQISPNDSSVALNPFELGLSAPDVSRVTLLDLPPSNPALTAGRSRFATKVDASTVARLDADVIATRGVDDSWRAPLTPFVGVQHLVVPDSKYDRPCTTAHRPVRLIQALVTLLSHIDMTSPDANAL